MSLGTSGTSGKCGGENIFGLDLDKPSELKKLMMFYNLRWAFPKKKILVELSSGREGLHYKIPDLTLEPEQDMSIRAYLGDCAGRLYFSHMRYEMGGTHNILFDFKRKNGKLVFNLPQDEKNLISLPFLLVGRDLGVNK